MKTIKYVTLSVTLTVVLLMPCFGEEADEKLLKKAAAIHERVLTIDTHVDTPFMLEIPGFDISKVNDPRKRGGKVDFPRMKKGGIDAIFFAVFVGQGKRTPEGNQKVKNRALKLFDLIHKTVKAYPNLVELALTSDDAYKIEKKGKRALYIGIENGYAVGKDMALVKKYYDLGARYITLCHTRNNDICDSSTDRKGPEHNGLSEFGKKVVKEMNRLGMLIDVSHISDKSFYDVLEVSKAPVFASHSCARAICDNPRNLTDDMLKKLAKNGGVIQVCILGEYVKKPPPNPQRTAAIQELFKKYKDYDSMSEEEKKKAREEWMAVNEKFPVPPAFVSDAVNHIDHIVKVAGIDHVGIGTDFDGGGGLTDCFDVSQMGNITLELVKRGYTEEQIRKIWGGNFMRVFRAVEKIAKKN
jgi:membrane dipeptidase